MTPATFGFLWLLCVTLGFGGYAIWIVTHTAVDYAKADRHMVVLHRFGVWLVYVLAIIVGSAVLGLGVGLGIVVWKGVVVW
jgi:hypothetical protein